MHDRSISGRCPHCGRAPGIGEALAAIRVTLQRLPVAQILTGWRMLAVTTYVAGLILVDHGASLLRAGERRMLQVLARHYPLKVTRAQLGTLAQFAPSGGTFPTYFGTLKRHWLIAESGDEVQITRAGMDFLGADVPPRPQTTAELLELWRGALRSGERKMLDELVAVSPGTLNRAELGERAGYTAGGGTFGAYLGTLRRNGLVDVDGDAVRASETLFLSRVVS